MRAVTLISTVIFIALSMTVIAVLLYTALPVIGKMQTAAITQQAKGIIAKMSAVIDEVASEGSGSRRVMYIDLKGGRIEMNASRDSIYWKMDSDVELISPRTAQDIGNLRFGNNLETNAIEGEYDGKPVWIIENQHIKVYVQRIGNATHHQNISTSEILLAVFQKDTGEELKDFFEVIVNDDPDTAEGIGWTEIERVGYDLPYARVRAHVHNEISYWFDVILESGADFLIIEGGLE